MKFLVLPVLAFLAGCAQFDAGVADLNTPATQQAFSTIRTLTATVACALRTTAKAKTIYYTATTDACILGGGTLPQ